MSKYLKHIIAFAVYSFLMLMPAISIASSSGSDTMAFMLFDLIKKARINPVNALEEYELDIAALINCHPAIEEYLDQGLPDVVPDTRLYVTASVHAQDMAENNYFSKISQDGSTPNERFLQAGFYSGSSDEIIGAVLFQNYLSKEDAVNALWKTMLGNELDCEKQPEAIIFNPLFREIGISIQSGTLEINGIKFNFYIAVCDFGKDVVSPGEKETFNSNNKVRAIPQQLFQINDTVEIEEFLQESLSPYGSKMEIYTAAKNSIERLFENPAVAAEPDLALIDRLADQGYNASSALETLKMWITVDEKSRPEIGEYLLREFLTAEINLPVQERVLLSPYFQDSGIAVMSFPVVLYDKQYFANVMAVVAATPVETAETFICTGNIRILADPLIEAVSGSDNDSDAVSDKIPSVEGVLLQVTGEEMSFCFFTGRSGEFAIELLPGDYSITCPENTRNLIISDNYFTISDQNIFIMLDCEKEELP